MKILAAAAITLAILEVVIKEIISHYKLATAEFLTLNKWQLKK